MPSKVELEAEIKKLENLKEQIKDLEEVNRAYQRDLNEKDAQVQSLVNKERELTRENGRLSQANSSQHDEIGELKREIHTLQGDSKGLHSKIATLESQFKALELDNACLEGQCKAFREMLKKK